MKKYLFFLIAIMPKIIFSQCTIQGVGIDWVSDTACLKTLTPFYEGQVVYLKQLSSENSNGGGFFVSSNTFYTSGIIAFDMDSVIDNSGKQWVRESWLSNQEYINVKWSGAMGDGINDDSEEIRKAIITASESDKTLFFPSGTYKLTDEINISINNKCRLKGEKGSIIKSYSSNTSQYSMIKITDATKGIYVDNLMFDGSDKIAECLKVENSSEDMNNVGDVYLTDCVFKNAFQTSSVLWATSAYIRGGFNNVVISNCVFRDVSSVKTSGAVTAGLTIAQTFTKNNWSKNVVISDCVFENIDNLTTMDSDGLKVFSNPTTPEGYPNPASLIVKGCRFVNCKGRSIKSQVKNNIISNNSFYRDKYKGNVEVDIQRSGGTVSNNNFYYQHRSSQE